MKPPLLLNKRRGFLLAVAACAASTGGFTAALLADKSKGGAERVIPITVKRFEYTPRDIRLKKGEPVVLEITSLDVPHGFNLPDFQLRADILPGQPARVRFVPDRTGTFTFRCDVFCGTGHEDLDGLITVSE
jgi:cytochrome c oxidase subunit II